MSDSEYFDNLDIKQRIKKFSDESAKTDANNNKFADLAKNNSISRSMPDIGALKKPPLPPKPKPSPNKIDTGAPPWKQNSNSTTERTPIPLPSPKPRPITMGCIPPNLENVLQKRVPSPTVAVVCVDTDSTTAHSHKMSCCETNRLNPVPQPKPRRRSADTISTSSNNVDNEQIPEKRNSNFRRDVVDSAFRTNTLSDVIIGEDVRTNELNENNRDKNKENVLRKLSAGPPSLPLPVTPVPTKSDGKFAVLTDKNVQNKSNPAGGITSIKQKKARHRNELAYEINDIDPYRTNSLNADRRNTLDGIILGDDGDDEEEDPYTYAYEHSPMFPRKSEKKPPQKSLPKEEEENIYDPIDYTLKDSLRKPSQKDTGDSVYEDPDTHDCVYEDPDTGDCVYEDPDTIDFRLPKLPVKETRSSDSTDDYESPYEGSAPTTPAGEDLDDYDFPDGIAPPPIPSHKRSSKDQQATLGSSIIAPVENSDDDDDYDTPDEDIKPPIPCHKNSKVAHKHDDDDSDSPEYTDPTTFCSEPAKSLRVKIPPLSSNKDSKFDKYDDFDSPEYTDPTDPTMFSTVPPTLPPKSTKRGQSDENSDDSPDYTDPTLISSEPPIPYKDRDLPPLPPHVAAVHEKAEDSDTPDYTDSSSFPTEPPLPYRSEKSPPIPSHRNSKFDKYDDFDSPDYKGSTSFPTEPPPTLNRDMKPPPIPVHRASQNFGDSSSEEDDDPEYTDPSIYCSAPPVPPGSHKFRNGSIYRPAQYLPGKKIPSLDEDDDDISLDYTDPELAFRTEPGTICEDDEEEIYSDEPLYQVYNDIVNKDMFRQNKLGDESMLAEQQTDSLHFADFVTGGKKATRMLWSELPSVRLSGTLHTMDSKERKRQEAIFEVITSEASYLKSLDILVTHFMMSKEFLPNPNLPSADPNEVQILDRHEYHFLYSGISSVKGVSERFLKDLRKCQKESIMFTSISDIILDYAKNHFQTYIKYCSNQVFQDRTLQSLKKHNIPFAEALTKLEADPKCQNLSMQSFLMLPMQRITRLPLLVDAICNLCEHGSDEFNSTDRALKAINSVVFSCNEGARKMERTEEMYFIQKTLEFKYKPIPLVSASRWLVKKGGITCSYEEGKIQKYKTHLRSIFKGKAPFYLFLFTDLVILTKMRSEDNFKVVDYCDRSMLKVQLMENIPPPEVPRVGSYLGTQIITPLNYAFTLIFLENIQNKTQEYHCFMKAESSEVTRWMEALNPPRGDIDTGEAIYEEWDCPQVQVVHTYQAGQSDELTLIEGDIISVLRKLPDGWAEGLRLRDDEKGWFPINHTDEIDSKHMRARNLMQRYRLLNASQNIVNQLSMR